MKMKRVLLLGATGTAGSAITKRLLLETDYHITLFARHASKIFSDNSRVTVIDGNASNKEELQEAMQGQDVIYSAISGIQLPEIAENIVETMDELRIKQLIFMGAIGIYNEIPNEIDGKDNVDNESAQVPNRQAVDVVESSDLNYTILRPGYLRSREENDFVLTIKGQSAKGYITTIPSITKLAVQLISDESLYSRESVSVTKDATIK